MNALENRNPDSLLRDNVFLNSVDELINASRCKRLLDRSRRTTKPEVYQPT